MGGGKLEDWRLSDRDSGQETEGGRWEAKLGDMEQKTGARCRTVYGRQERRLWKRSQSKKIPEMRHGGR